MGSRHGAEEAHFHAHHKQWKDVMVLTSDGKFWRHQGFRRYEESSGSAGKWVCEGTKLTLLWFKWDPEELVSNTGGRSFEGAGDYQFDLTLMEGQRIPGWLVKRLSETQSLDAIKGIVRTRHSALRAMRSLGGAQIADLLKQLTEALVPFAGKAARWVPAFLSKQFDAVGWDFGVNRNKSAVPPTAEAMVAFMQKVMAKLENPDLPDDDDDQPLPAAAAATAAAAAASSDGASAGGVKGCASKEGGEGLGGSRSVSFKRKRGQVERPQLENNLEFRKRIRAGSSAVIGDDETTIVNAEWIFYSEPDMVDVSWGDAEVGIFKAGDLVPTHCVLWGWVAHILTELAYPNDRLTRPKVKQGMECSAAANLLSSIRPFEPRELPALLLVSSSGHMYVIARPKLESADGRRDRFGPAGYRDRGLLVTRLAPHEATSSAGPAGSAVSSGAVGVEHHLSLFLANIVSDASNGLVNEIFVHDLVASAGRSMVRKPLAVRMRMLEEIGQCFKGWADSCPSVEKITHRPGQYAADWAFPNAGMIEYIDGMSVCFVPGDAKTSSIKAFKHAYFDRDYTICFWVLLVPSQAPGASVAEPSKSSRPSWAKAQLAEASTRRLCIMRRGNIGGKLSPGVWVHDDDRRLEVACSLDGDHAFGIKRSAKPLPEGVWTHVAINVSFEQRVLEVLVDGMVDTQQPLPPTKGFFVNGKMVPLLVGDPSGKVEPGARLAGFHVALVQVYPTAALSHGSIGAVIKLHRASLLFGSEDFPGPAAVAQGALEAEKASGEKGEGSAVVRNGGLAEIRSRAAALASKDKRVGFPGTRPSVSQNPHGWFFPSHKVVLDLLLTPETKCVLELGSWLGKSTKFIRKCAPNAFIFCIDLWENDYVLADPHYTDEASETAAAGPQRTKQVEENIAILRGAPIYEVFLANMWSQRSTDTKPGVVPLKMTTLDGIQLLADAGIVPEVIYIDANHHYDPVLADIGRCAELFPEAAICGDDWDYPDVMRAAKEIGFRRKDNLAIHAEMGKCWTYTIFEPGPLVAMRRKYYDTEAEDRPEWRNLYGEVLGLFSPELNTPEAAAEATRKALKGKLATPEGKPEGKPVDSQSGDVEDQDDDDRFPVDYGLPPKGRTLLMAAASKGLTDVARVLIEECGADPNVQTKGKGESSLHLAAYFGFPAVVELLLSYSEANAAAATGMQLPALDAGLVNEHGENAAQAGKWANNPQSLKCAEMITAYHAKQSHKF